jgi:hypothetical protein
MSALGLSCNVAEGRVTVRGVTIDGDDVTEVFLHRSAAGEDQALQLRSLGDALATRLADLGATAVVVRSADHHSAARVTEAIGLRLRAEGVLLATARTRVAAVASLSGREIGDKCGESKAEVEARAKGLLTSAATEATAAALAAAHLGQDD